MSNYLLEVKDKIELYDYSTVEDYIRLVDENDNITIRFTNAEKDDISIIKKVLENKNLKIYHEEDFEKGEYSIKACKNNYIL